MKQCTVENCGRKHYGRGFCNAHYQRAKNGVDLTLPVRHNRKNKSSAERDANGNKLCIHCNVYLPEHMFQDNPISFDKKQPYCVPCISERRYVSNYGIKKSEIQALLVRQNGCAICQTKDVQGDKNWHVDHDHACCPGVKTCGNCVRGILCGFCNRALGQFKDSPETLLNAVHYLVKARIKNQETHVQDLEKAMFYIKDEIRRLQQTRTIQQLHDTLQL